MKKHIAGIVLCISIAFTCSSVFASSAGIKSWDADISGTIMSSGTDINLKNDLGLKDEQVTEFNFDLNFFGPKAYVHYYKVDNSGTNTLTQNITYNGTTYTASDTVHSKLEQTVIDVNFSKSVLKSDALQVDLLGGLKYLDLDASITNNAGTLHSSDSVKALVPTIGVGAQSHIGSGLLAKASISGLDISVDGKKVDTYDLKYGIEYKPAANVAIGAGVQKSKLLAQDDDNKGDLRRDGNYFEVIVKF